MRAILISFSAGLLLAAGLGCGAAKRGPGEACAETLDCRDNLVCTANECTAPGACPKSAPVSCGDGTCCMAQYPICCPDGSCYQTSADCKEATCDAKSCRNSAGCCTGYVCAAGLNLCQLGKDIDLGDTCTASSQCKSKTCLGGACTKRCLADQDCDLGLCLFRAGAAAFYCTPLCSAPADCSVYGPLVSCREAAGPDGTKSKGCM